ncbi:MAG TPA: SMC-Scp complex subunit ScpB [Steroidobacteraceae bacterium]
MNDSYIRNVIEAALLAAGGPLPVAELMRLFDDAVRPGAQAVREALASLGAEYEGRGIELKETASGFRIQVRRELTGEISRLWPERAARYSRALLETLALIAFKEVVARSEMFAHHHIRREQLSVGERMKDIVAALAAGAFVPFTQLFRPEEGRMGVTVTFVAILELMREGLIDIVQAHAYAPLHVRGTGPARVLHVVADNVESDSAATARDASDTSATAADEDPS